MCNEDKVEILNVDFANSNDEFNWVSDATTPVQTNGGQLVLKPDNATTQFKRNLGSIANTKNRVKLFINLDVVRPQGTVQSNFCAVLEVLNGVNIVGQYSIYLTGISTGDVVEYSFERDYKYSDLSGNISLRLTVEEGFQNEVKLDYLRVENYNYCEDNIRTYFVIPDLLADSIASVKSGIKLFKYEIDGVETLTQDFFTEVQTNGSDPELEWFLAKANIDGSNRIQEVNDPNTFNPFEKEFGLSFDTVNSYHGGKANGTLSGSDYGTGIQNIGVLKPKILKGDLTEVDSAFFVDIDYSKNLKIEFDVIIGSQNNIYLQPSYFRKYFIEWDAKNCLKAFYYKDQVSEGTVNVLEDGFLYGLTGEITEIELASCTESFLYKGQGGVTEVEMDFGTATGTSGIGFNASDFVVKFEIIYNSQIYSTGYVGSNLYDQQLLNSGISASEINTGNPNDPTTGIGQLLFDKTQAQPNSAIIRMTTPLENADWSISGVCPFSLQSSQAFVKKGSCQDSGFNNPQNIVFFDVNDISSYTPTIGDVVYLDAQLTQPFNGDGFLHFMSFDSGQGTLTVNITFRIGTDGVISDVIDCSGQILPGVSRYTPTDNCVQSLTGVIQIPDGNTDDYVVQFRGYFYKDANYSQLQPAISPNLPANVIRNDQDVIITETTRFQVSIFGGYSGQAVPSPVGDNRRNIVVATVLLNGVSQSEYWFGVFNEGLNCE